jgi:hypothetical protein
MSKKLIKRWPIPAVKVPTSIPYGYVEAEIGHKVVDGDLYWRCGEGPWTSTTETNNWGDTGVNKNNWPVITKAPSVDADISDELLNQITQDYEQKTNR